ncbi:PTS lactose/cellobiose transporter subunit IIA [Bacillus solimangrovi]|uniref:PTS sorbose transporter subunit IIC n=1 Tax=Bacillus solimangrovi TaxID=1305675 RepID=A0A1E5LBR5_9BACI|nr:PTS lactose/cellobiose transporter subunit IIA [Bacillus solimangrovi]OEH91534.1 PTS sorbose transporter subunit IIC [Bacillus solimangrovi]
MSGISEEMQMKIFGLIAGAGDAKSSFYQAMKLVQENKYEEAEELVKEAKASLVEAHKVQTSLITEEANGNQIEVGILMVHAQDHLMNAILVQELLDNLISMQKEINGLKEKLEVVNNG